MLRSIISAAFQTKNIVKLKHSFGFNQPLIIPLRLVSSLPSSGGITLLQKKSHLNSFNTDLLKNLRSLNFNEQRRTLTKFSLRKGKRKAVKAVVKRFKRLDWGCWIRTHSGRNKKIFKKSLALRRRLKQHVLVNASQSFLLDKMVTKFWKKPKYYINDPYDPYIKREEYWATRRKPADF